MKKCPVCGSKNIYENGNLIYTSNYNIPLEGCTCVDCGYVMLFSPKLAQEGKQFLNFNDYLIRKFTLFSEILDKNFPITNAPNTDKLNSLNNQLSAIEKVISDENQTVKAVKEAQQQKKELEEQIRLERNTIDNQNKSIESTIKIKYILSVDGYKELIPYNCYLIHSGFILPQDAYETHIKKCLDKFGEQLYNANRISQVYTLVEQLKQDIKRMR